MSKPPLQVFVANEAVGSMTRSDVEPDTILFGYHPGVKPQNAVSLTMPVRVDHYEYPELAANEFICMRGAAAAGVDTARVQLSENRQFLVVDRFDLAADGSNLGMEDFCVLEGRRSHGRYDGYYEGVAKRMSDYVSPSALARATEQLALIVAYSCSVGNGDAHLKNFSVIYRHPEDEVGLAPAYDIVSTLPYLPQDTLALELSGTKAFPNRALDQARASGDR